jgi:invasin B
MLADSVVASKASPTVGEAFAFVSLPQLTPPCVSVATGAGTMQSAMDALKLVAEGGGPDAAARIAQNAAAWEVGVTEKAMRHTAAVSTFSLSVDLANDAVDAADKRSPASITTAMSSVASALRNEMQCRVSASALPTTPEALNIDVSEMLSGTAKLTMALAKLEKMMSSSDIDALDSQRKMLNELAENRQASLQKSADDYAAKVAEAQRLQDTMGEIAKIGGWALTIIGVGLAVFTGGASLLIAAAGLALMAADAIYKAVTGTSFIDEAMKPVMDHVVKPMMEWLSKQVTSALESCGVSKDKAEIAGAVVAGVAMAAVLVTGVVAVGSVGGKIASAVAESTAKELGEVMESAVVRSLKDVMVKLADDSGVSSLASRAKSVFAEMRAQVGLDTLEEGQINALATRGKVGLTVGETAMSGAQAAVNTIAAADTKDASVMQAAVTRAIADKKVIAALLQELSTVLSNSASAMTSLNEAMSNTLKNEMATDSFVLNNARAV